MICHEFESVVVDLARDQVADEVRRVAEHHAADCEACAARLATERDLTRRLRQFSAATCGVGAPPHLEAVILNEFRGCGGPPSVAAGPGHAWWPWLAAAAALVLIAGAYGVPRLFVPAAPVRSAATTEPVATPAPAPPVVREATESGTSAPAMRPAATNATGLAPRAATRRAGGGTEVPSADGTVEDDAEYYAVPLSAPMLENATLVPMRVQVSRASLVALGLPLHRDDEWQEVVRAEVLVGEDGLARAIRLVENNWEQRR